VANLLRKINCPSGTHEDSTPSCAVYTDGSGWCFSCSKYFKQLEEPMAEIVPKEKENLDDSFKYISTLPLIVHRGLSFPHDNRGYYIRWPNDDYYKMRMWAPKLDEPKYMGAKGHKKPWFYLRHKSDSCIVVEGEINALSLNELNLGMDILSPGGASNFYDSEMRSTINSFKRYKTVIVLVDKDAAGLKAAIEFHKLVKPYCLDVRVKLMEKGQDCNEILVKENGKEELKKTILGM
jgi:5S rRNA maturation endonuclease (ribonuclease M5)